MKKEIITGITMGEPGGIASEIMLKVWKKYRKKMHPFFYMGDIKQIEKTNSFLNYNIPIKSIKKVNECIGLFQDYLPVYEIKLKDKVTFGKSSINNSLRSLFSIKKGVQLALKKKISAIVTSPIEKSVIRKKKKNFSGHTFYIAKLTSIRTPIMFLTSPKLNVVPLTQHISLRQAIKGVTKKRIILTTKLINKCLIKDFGLKKPKIAITGLNPHAGEDGHFGNEEKTIIKPAIKKIENSGIDINGPFPADTIFNTYNGKKFDAIICMYHDQATIPIKTLDFHFGVNITLGIPIIRTSPDHGVAMDIAGKGLANEKSFYSAIKKAEEMSLRRKNWIQ